ncbi:RNA polymerase sigma factor [candidate division KSB1 bacterium]
MADERELIESIRSGEKQSFRKLVERYQKDVYRLALNMTGSHHDAEDISQDVFIKAYRSVHSFRGDSKLGTWLYRVTINTCIDKRKKKSVSALEFHESECMDTGAEFYCRGNIPRAPDAVYEKNEINRHVERAITALSPRERSVFVLRHYHNMQVREVADVLVVSTGTVKSLLYRAVRKLQKELAFYEKEI